MSVRVDRPADVEWRQLDRKKATAHAYVNGEGRCTRARQQTRNPRLPVDDPQWPCEQCIRSVEPRECIDCGEMFIKAPSRGHSPSACNLCLQRWWDALVLRRTDVREIAARTGITHQGVSHLIVNHFGDLQSAQVAVRMLREAAEATARRCGVCNGQLPSNRLTVCSDECWDVWRLLHRHADDDRYSRHRQAVARWYVNNPGSCSEKALRGFEEILDDPDSHEVRGRWLCEGSDTWDAAVNAYRRGWDIFDALPAQIREQVEEYLSERKAAA